MTQNNPIEQLTNIDSTAVNILTLAPISNKMKLSNALFGGSEGSCMYETSYIFISILLFFIIIINT